MHVVQVQTGGKSGNSATNVRSRTVQARSSRIGQRGKARRAACRYPGPQPSTSNVEVVATGQRASAPLSWDSGNGLTPNRRARGPQDQWRADGPGKTPALLSMPGSALSVSTTALSHLARSLVEFTDRVMLAEGTRVTLSGKNAGFRANGRDYSAIQDPAVARHR